MKKLSQEEVINRFELKHKDKYDYSLVEYKNQRTKVKIICKEHGIFEMITSLHFSGQGCAECAGVKKHTLATFIKKAKTIHKDKYDYSIVEYLDSRTKVKIICKEHGEFEQTPFNHMQGQHCPKCANILNGIYKRMSWDDFIDKSTKKHGNKYDYCISKYDGLNNKIEIICPIHGKFEQTPASHLNSCGCFKCTSDLRSIKGSWDYVKKFENNKELGRKEGIFYVLNFKHKELGFEFIKIGITSNDIQTRFHGYNDYEYTILIEHKKTMLECATLEKFYKNEFINQKYNFKFPANLNFNGKTECFQMEVSNYFIGFQ